MSEKVVYNVQLLRSLQDIEDMKQSLRRWCGNEIIFCLSWVSTRMIGSLHPFSDFI